MSLVPLETVQREVLGVVTRLEPARVELDAALGLTLVETVRSDEPVPPFANTAMDGYAVRAADDPEPHRRAGPARRRRGGDGGADDRRRRRRGPDRRRGPTR